MAVAQTANPGSLSDLAKLKNFESQRVSSSDPNWKNGNTDARPIPAGATLEIANMQGPGEIDHIWFTTAARDVGYSRLVVLRMYWDGEKNPSVECPLGDFFGMGHGLDIPFDSLPVRVTADGKGRNCYWPMPFGKSARITVTNEGNSEVGGLFYYIDWKKLPKPDTDAAYFHAMYRQEFPTVMGRNYLIADIEGRGHYVGTVLSWKQLTDGWPGEGDDFFFIDGEKEPSLRGTGTEDYFCDGWGFRKQAGPYYGAPIVEGQRAGDRTTVYRWHITDPIAFKKSLRMEIEHKGMGVEANGNYTGFMERADNFSSVAFWYQTEPHKPYLPMPKGYARMYFDYSKSTEGESLVKSATATDGDVINQYLGCCSDGHQLWWRLTKPDQTLTIPLEVKESGNYEILIALVQAPDYGIFQFDMDGKPMGGPIDLHNPNVTPLEYTFPKWQLEAGRHTLTVRCIGKRTAATGYSMGFDFVLFQKRG
jgi:hypothetical protein